MFSRTTIASSTTRPTATARPPRVMMFRVIPVACMITRAARIESGMLTAATIVERMLNRNRKIVRTANRAPRPPSRRSPSRDSLMKFDRSETTVIAHGVGVLLAELVELGRDGVGDLDGVGVRGLGDRQRHRGLAVGARVAGGRDALDVDRAEVADRDRRRAAGTVGGVAGAEAPGAADAPGAAEADRRCARLGPAPAPGTPVAGGVATPTTMFATCVHGSMRPIVETGIFEPSVETAPDGKVRLLAASTPVTWAIGDAVRGELRRVERDEDALLLAAGDVDAADALDAEQRGLDLVLGDARGLGEAVLRLGGDRGDDHRRGVDVERRHLGRDGAGQPGVLEVLLDRRPDLLDVGAERELGNDQRQRVGRRRLEGLQARHARDRPLDRLRHLLGDVGRAGARQRRDDGDHREVDVGQELLLEPAPREEAGDEQRPRPAGA